MFKTLDSMKWLIGALFLVFFIGMYTYVKTAFDVWEPPPQGYSTKELLHSTDAQLMGAGNEQQWKMESPIFDGYAIPLGESELEFTVYSEQNLDIQEARIVVELERPATLRNAQKLEFQANSTDLPAKKVTIKGKINVADMGRWELSAFAVINEEAGVRQIQVFDTSGK